jgi:hypothetical protein
MGADGYVEHKQPPQRNVLPRSGRFTAAKDGKTRRKSGRENFSEGTWLVFRSRPTFAAAFDGKALKQQAELAQR